MRPSIIADVERIQGFKLHLVPIPGQKISPPAMGKCVRFGWIKAFDLQTRRLNAGILASLLWRLAKLLALWQSSGD